MDAQQFVVAERTPVNGLVAKYCGSDKSQAMRVGRYWSEQNGRERVYIEIESGGKRIGYWLGGQFYTG